MFCRIAAFRAPLPGLIAYAHRELRSASGQRQASRAELASAHCLSRRAQRHALCVRQHTLRSSPDAMVRSKTCTGALRPRNAAISVRC